MPEISRFFGIIIAMFYDDHAPPHFHVRYGEQKAIIAIDTLTILRGQLAPRAHGLVMEWAALHKEELLEDWTLAENQAPLKRLSPWNNLCSKTSSKFAHWTDTASTCALKTACRAKWISERLSGLTGFLLR